MSERVRVVWDERLKQYDFGAGHPLAPIRVQLAMRLSEDFGLFAKPNVTIGVPAEQVTETDLLRVHGAEYIAAVKAAGEGVNVNDLRFGLGTGDVPVFAHMHEASLSVCSATTEAARAVWSGQFDHAINLAGGLHHAMPSNASGFCVYNDIGVAIAWLLEQGVERIAYVDVDVHHGDGVQTMFYNDPRVLTISLHESGRTLFPGTGAPTEIGGPGAQGSAINVALPAGTADNGWLRAFAAVVPEALRAFAPQIIVSQQGCDTHFDDPLAHLALSVDGQRRSYELIHELAHELCEGRWVAVGGGGYEWVDVVPRAWTHLVAEVVGSPIDPATPTPATFHELVREVAGRPAPARMTDGTEPFIKTFESGYDPSDSVDRAILATREAVFPTLGLTADPFSPF